MENLENRKKDHIELAFKSQTTIPEMDSRFHYEPMLQAHPKAGICNHLPFWGKQHRFPCG